MSRNLAHRAACQHYNSKCFSTNPLRDTPEYRVTNVGSGLDAIRQLPPYTPGMRPERGPVFIGATHGMTPRQGERSGR